MTIALGISLRGDLVEELFHVDDAGELLIEVSVIVAFRVTDFFDDGINDLPILEETDIPPVLGDQSVEHTARLIERITRRISPRVITPAVAAVRATRGDFLINQAKGVPLVIPMAIETRAPYVSSRSASASLVTIDLRRSSI